VAEAAASPNDPARAVETRSQRQRRWALFLGLAALVILLDQATKLWVDASFDVASRAIPAGQPGGPTEVIGDLLRIAKTYNDGAIFGLFEAVAPIMAALSLLVIGGITWFEWRHGAAAGTLVTVGLGLLLGGAIGNLIDRVRIGQVIDFVDMGAGDARWYAWNISDAAVFVGILVLFAAALLGDRAARRGSTAGRSGAGDPGQAGTSGQAPTA
jgi:signal peptidase II